LSAITDLIAVLSGIDASITDYELRPAVDKCVSAFKAGNKLLICGNGGSALQAQHLAAELVVRFETDRQALAAIALSADSGVVTATGNDYGYERVFSRQVEALGRPGDVLIGYSTSGKSANVANAFAVATHIGMGTIGFCGDAGWKCDPEIWVKAPSLNTARIQETHLLYTHMLVQGIEAGLK
jgi:D-sedoheptulose 7-phosphate isomerase